MKLFNQAKGCTNCTGPQQALLYKSLRWYSTILINYTVTIPTIPFCFFANKQRGKNGVFTVPLEKSNCTTRRPRPALAPEVCTVGTAKTAVFSLFFYRKS
ncbi:MAG: hypothetical protein WC504_01450 [Methylobacter sp.]|jgi:hypothetical protein